MGRDNTVQIIRYEKLMKMHNDMLDFYQEQLKDKNLSEDSRKLCTQAINEINKDKYK